MTQDLPDGRGVLEWITPQINPHSGVPIYLQITQAFVRAIQRGTVRPGDSLPTVRHLAATLRLAPNTVTRAYAELQRQGLIESRAGAGTTVRTAPATPSVTEAGRQALVEELHDLLHRMTASGLTLADLRALFEQFTLSREREAL
ncbi:GntR family transcriptional regulator [Deinococcus metalli]|uniref:GntR family transcriptional regulator n=1 Tax=Deinococcus metalli TaxID=1141878 RepID=A0A7W8NRC4_9DEIO|nr:GntR family transcriptional regulator [Deinococcus metalli]MBB5378816.1 GntR family transcriptional regulator [Deinococcus metalli]GHF60555.1 GntR family transcriptional regulator [Deinococcus metalli]